MLLLTGGAQLGDDWVLSDDDFTPTTDIGWYSSFWAEDPLWTNKPADGVAVDRWRNAGTLRTSGAHLTSDGLVLPGVVGNYASVPDSNALDITGDITLVARVAMTDWTPGAETGLLSKWTATGDQRSYLLTVVTSGRIRLHLSANGATSVTAESTVAADFTDESVGWVAATYRVDDGAGNRVATFWTSADGVTWTQLGSTVTTVGTLAIFNSTAPLNVGSWSAGTAGLLNGTLSVARVYSGSGFTTSGPSGTLVLDADFRTTPGATSFTAATGQPVSVLSTFSANQATGSFQPTYRGSVAALNNRPAVDFDGTDDRLEITAGVSLAQPFSVVWIGATDATSGIFVGSNSSSTSRYALGISGAPRWAMNAGSTHAGGSAPVVGAGAMVRNYLNDAASVSALNGVAGAPDPAGSGAMDQIVLGCGRAAPSTYQFFQDGKTAFLGIFPGDITTSPRWPDFKAWCRSHYNVTVA